MDTNDFLQMFRAQEVARQAEAVGLLYATMIGGLAGMAPLIYGATKKRLGMGFLGFFLCLLAGYFGSLFFAGPVAAVFVGWIAALHNREMGENSPPQSQSYAYPPRMPQQHPKPITSPMKPDQYERLGDDKVRFPGNGTYASLSRIENGSSHFVGTLPQTVQLPEDGTKTTYTIRLAHGREFIGEFARATVAPPKASIGSESPIDGLSRLKNLRDSGDITPDEFERLKRHLLESTI